MILLQEEAELNEIVQLVGLDAISYEERIKLEAARSVREDYLHQNSFHEIDTYSSLHKQYLLLKLIMTYYYRSVDALAEGVDFDALISLEVREKIGRFKYVEEKDIDTVYEEIDKEMVAGIGALTAGEAV